MLLALLAALSGCPPGRTCGPLPLSVNPAKAFGIAGQRLTIDVWGPLVQCEGENAAAVISVIRPDNQPFAAVTSSGSYDNAYGSRKEKIEFTPDAPGIWQLIVTFEPSLGRVQVPIDVAEERLNTPRISTSALQYARYCTPQPFRTLNGLMLCEINGHVSAQREDGGQAEFDGGALMVLGNTVWSSDGPTLTRRTDTGRELRVDAVVNTGAAPRSDRGFTTEHTAILAFTQAFGSTVTRYDFDDGGLLGSPVQAKGDDEVFLGDGKVFRFVFTGQAQARVCGPGDGGAVDCTSLSGTLLRFDDGLWVDTASGSVAEHRRSPFIGVTPSTFTIAQGWAFEKQSSSGPLTEHEPLVVVSQKQQDLALLVSSSDPEVRLAHYGDGEILGTRGNYVVLRSIADGGVTFAEF